MIEEANNGWKARKLPQAISAALALMAFASNDHVVAAETFRQLKGAQIRSRLVGMEFTDEVHWALVFGRDGTLTTISMGKNSAGRWHVKQDQLCLDRSVKDQRCYAVWISGKALQLREPGVDIYEEGVLQRPAARN